jgi:hypothetical protein
MSVSRFDRNEVFRTPEDVTHLAERLAKCPVVTQFDEGEHKEAWALADSFSDLESSFREFLNETLPKLASSEGEELSGLLFELGVDLKHIIYHILEQQKFYRYITPTTDVSFQPPKRA